MADEYVIWGRRPVLEALEAGSEFNKIVVARGSADPRIIAAARERRIPVIEADREALDRIVGQVGGGAHQGVAAYVSPILYVELDAVVAKAADRGESLFVVLLDGIEDPQNLGSIIRTADAAGAHGVVIPARRSALVSPAVVRASSGAAEHTLVARVANLSRAIDDLKKAGAWVVGTSPDAKKKYFEADLSGPIAVVVGNEGRGMSHLVSTRCDFTVSMPMAGPIASLNAGAAWAVIAYEVVRQRTAGSANAD
ncbi:MAG: 23S rRNA (guanosine(2251)-2'-O)-methyltransferase RlmB [Clostridia bacterium]|nr:23S rRNA (guanosine(2251)-2'-O)-methyltransferase RlmB [Clostridia bacterium]